MVRSFLVYVLILLTVFSLTDCKRRDDSNKAVVKPIVEAVYASGYVVAKNEYEVYSQTEGFVLEKLAEDGDEIRQGDPLFIIDADQQSARYRIAKENYEMAAHNYGENSPVLNELSASLEVAYTKMKYDSVNFVRYTNLLNSNAVTRADYDRIKLTYENSRNEYNLQKSRFEKTKNQLYLEFKNADNQLRIATDESKQYTIRSQVTGMIFKTMKEPGELIRRGEVIAVVGKKDDFYLELNVDELDIGKIQKKQKVLVKIDAYPNKIFNAEVSHIYPMINKQQQSVKVDAMMSEPLPGWFSGLALEANIIIREKEHAIVIPKTKLLPGDSVWVESKDGRRKVKVETGIETLDEIEILSGIDTSDQLIGAR